MTTGIVIMNAHPLQTFEQYCRNNKLKYLHANRAEDEAENEYILLSAYHNVCGCQFDKVIIFSDFMYDVFVHLSPRAIGDFYKQNKVAIMSERCLYEYNI